MNDQVVDCWVAWADGGGSGGGADYDGLNYVSPQQCGVHWPILLMQLKYYTKIVSLKAGECKLPTVHLAAQPRKVTKPHCT